MTNRPQVDKLHQLAPEDAKQFKRFQEAARELGADESEERFNEALKKVARHKPSNEGEKPTRKGKADPIP